MIVTGAASGIGLCFARRLSSESAAMGLLDLAGEPLSRVHSELESGPARVCMRSSDVSDRQALNIAFEELISELGGLDLLLHCAGILGPGAFIKQSPEEFEAVVKVDLLGSANVVRAGYQAIKQSKGAIACIASTAAVHGWPRMSAYSTAKFGVAGFCEAVATELARDGALLCTVFPLLIDTPMLAAADRAPILKQGKAISAEVVVEKTLRGLRDGKRRVYVPSYVRILAVLQALAPSLLDYYGDRFGNSDD